MSWTSGPIGVGLLRFEFDFDDSRSKSDRARTPKNNFNELGCVIRMVVDSILPHAESGPIDHQKDAPVYY